MSDDPKKERKKDDASADDPFDVPDVDESPPPQEFQRPKWLMNLKPQEPKADPPEVKSGAAHGTPPPLAHAPAKAPPARPSAVPRPPPAPRPAGANVAMDKRTPPAHAPPLAAPDASTAHVAMDRPTGRPPAPALESPDASTADVRIEKPQAANTEALRRLAEAAAQADVKMDRPAGQPANLEALKRLSESTFDVQPAVQKRPPPNLKPLEEGPVEIKMGTGDHPADKPKPDLPSAPTDFDVVVDVHAKNPLSQKLKVTKPRKAVGIVDTTFARFNMGDAAHDEIHKLGDQIDVVRRTVPGIKDLAVECKILFEEEDCDLVIACGMVGGQPIDKQCAHEASLAIQWAKLATNRHILEVFVHEDEATDDKQLAWLMDRRTREHALNAVWMLLEPHKLREQAGMGLRQGFDDAGPVNLP